MVGEGRVMVALCPISYTYGTYKFLGEGGEGLFFYNHNDCFL
jgi:hypothetical protein